MGWRRRRDTRTGDMAHGITFEMFESDTPGRGECAVNSKKLHMDGRVSLTLAFDQRKYGDELIAQVFTPGGFKVRERRADDYDRIQVYLGEAGLETAEMLEEAAKVIRQRRGL